MRAVPVPLGVRLWTHRLNLPNSLWLILCAPTTATAAQFTNSVVSMFPPFICFSDNLFPKIECLPALVLRDLFDCPSAFTSSSTSFVKLCVFPFSKQESQLLWFLLTNASAPSLWLHQLPFLWTISNYRFLNHCCLPCCS